MFSLRFIPVNIGRLNAHQNSASHNLPFFLSTYLLLPTFVFFLIYSFTHVLQQELNSPRAKNNDKIYDYQGLQNIRWLENLKQHLKYLYYTSDSIFTDF